MRRCTSCHEPIESETHAWLPFAERHMQVMACETCHIPEVIGPAQQSIDWTALRADGSPLSEFRGIEGDPTLPTSLITGYEPVFLQRQNGGG